MRSRDEINFLSLDKMLEFNLYSLVIVLMILLLLFAVLSHLQKPLEYRQLSSYVPSATKTFWSELCVSWRLATMQPKDVLPFFMSLEKKYGPVAHFNLSGRAYVLLNDPDDIKILLTSKENITKGPEYRMLKPWLNDGLLLSTGPKWNTRRKLLTETFHLKVLDMYNPTINKNARVLVENLLEAFQNEKDISIIKQVTLCSLDTISATIMGTEINAQDGESVEYVQSIKNVCKSVLKRAFAFWLWNDLIFGLSECGQTFYKSVKVLKNFTNDVIKKKRISSTESKNQESSVNGKTKKKSFIDILFNVLNEFPDQMTDDDIREEVETFLFAGHDTSAAAIAMTLILLGIYSDVQERARNEILSIFGDSDRDVTMEDLNAMKYVDAVVKETLRLYPSVPGITRELQSTLQIKNYSIPPKTVVAVFPYILHRSADIFANPEEFMPERFLDEDNKSKLLFGYLPFSAGPRNCIGQKFAMNQIKTIISTVLRRARIKTLGRKEDIKVSTQLVIRIDSLPKVEVYPI